MSNLSFTTVDVRHDMGAVNPMLAKLYYTRGFHEDEGRDVIDFVDHADMLDNITQVLETTATSADREMATDILVALLRQAEKNVKQALAERFAVMSNAPLRLMLQFVNDDIDVAKPVLMNSPVLNDLDLIYIIQSRDSPFWQAIAKREHIGEVVVDALVDTRDYSTAKALVENKAAALNEYALDKVVKFVEQDDDFASILLARSDIGQEFIRKIYSAAGASIKQAMQDKYGSSIARMSRVVDDVVGEYIHTARTPYTPTQSMVHAADLFYEQGKLTPQLMVNTLRRGQMASFVAQLARLAHLPVAIVATMLQQPKGHGLAITCKAYGIESYDFMAMYTLSHKIIGGASMNASVEAEALAYFNRVTPEVAKRLVSQSQKQA
jgi:uncharacterized protein (DUF2336 family)